MIKIGEFNQLRISREVEFGVYLDDGGEGILLPKRFVPKGAAIGDLLNVFLYHDSDSRVIATTQVPKGVVGEMLKLEVVSTTPQGAFLDWGLMKDLFVPRSQQVSPMVPGASYLVKIYIDQQTGRVAATQKITASLSNEVLTVTELESVDLLIYRRTDIGYEVIINGKHTGLIHFSDLFSEVETGDRLKGYIKTIRPDHKIDVAPGKPGYQKVEDEAGKILRLLNENSGFLPFHDKSAPEDIYAFFGMSKKTFKMTTGALFKQRKIVFTGSGIRLTAP